MGLYSGLRSHRFWVSDSGSLLLNAGAQRACLSLGSAPASRVCVALLTGGGRGSWKLELFVTTNKDFCSAQPENCHFPSQYVTVLQLGTTCSHSGCALRSGGMSAAATACEQRRIQSMPLCRGWIRPHTASAARSDRLGISTPPCTDLAGRQGKRKCQAEPVLRTSKILFRGRQCGNRKTLDPQIIQARHLSFEGEPLK